MMKSKASECQACYFRQGGQGRLPEMTSEQRSEGSEGGSHAGHQGSVSLTEGTACAAVLRQECAPRV